MLAVRLVKLLKNIKIVSIDNEIYSIGLSMQTNVNSIRKDVKMLKEKFKTNKSLIKSLKQPEEMIIVTKDYDLQSKDFIYFMGNVITEIYKPDNDLELFIIPKGKYAHIELKSFIALTYPFKLIRTKKYFFNDWLPESDYEATGILDDFEHHTRKSYKKFNFIVDYFVSIKDK